jgi:two-component system, chemotaxis family, chemotaxis protein CheY
MEQSDMPRILIVDDSTTVRQQLKMFLEALGHQVTQAVDGVQGLEAAEQNSFDLMVVDVNMPIMNGLDMALAVRKLPQHKKTPIFMLTTESTKEIVAQGKAAGVNAWMVKPFKPEFLEKGINKMLG